MFVSTQDGWSAIHLAAQEGNVDVMRLLLTEAQTLVNIQDKVQNHAPIAVSVKSQSHTHTCAPLYMHIVHTTKYIQQLLCHDKVH